MDRSNNEEDWSRYFKDNLGVEVEPERIIVQSWKADILFRDDKNFNDVAQAHGVKELTLNADGRLFYERNIPTSPGHIDEKFAFIALCPPKNFQGRYTIRKLGQSK